MGPSSSTGGPKQQQATFFSSFQLNSLHRSAARSPHNWTTVLDLFLLPRHPSDSNSTLSYIAVAVSASKESQNEAQVGFLFSETRCPRHQFRQYSMSFGQGWKLLKLEGTSLKRPGVQPPSSPHDEGLVHWFVPPKPPTFFHQKPLAEGSSKNAAALIIANGCYFRHLWRVSG